MPLIILTPSSYHLPATVAAKMPPKRAMLVTLIRVSSNVRLLPLRGDLNFGLGSTPVLDSSFKVRFIPTPRRGVYGRRRSNSQGLGSDQRVQGLHRREKR